MHGPPVLRPTHVSAHLALQLKDLSLVPLLQLMGPGLQCDQLLGDLWVAG